MLIQGFARLRLKPGISFTKHYIARVRVRVRKGGDGWDWVCCQS